MDPTSGEPAVAAVALAWGSIAIAPLWWFAFLWAGERTSPPQAVSPFNALILPALPLQFRPRTSGRALWLGASCALFAVPAAGALIGGAVGMASEGWVRTAASSALIGGTVLGGIVAVEVALSIVALIVPGGEGASSGGRGTRDRGP